MAMNKGVFAFVLAFVFALAINMNHAWAHSGGTDRHGCHAGTQPYHCHHGSDSDSDTETWLVVGGVIVAVVVIWAVLRNCDVTPNFREEFRLDESQLKPFYDVEEDRVGLKFTTPF